MFPKVLILLFMCAVCCQSLYEGDRCFQDGVQGVCLKLGQCKTAIEGIQYRRFPQICSFDRNNDVAPIVCCVEDKPASAPPEQDAEEDECEPLPDDYTAMKTGNKAFDMCIEYQLKYVYPCDRGVDLLGGVSRQNNCHHTSTELIIGGSDAAQYEFPHLVMLGYGDLNTVDWVCSGAIISERYILTAGHCTLRGKDNPVTYAAIGALKRTDAASDTSKIYKVQEIIKHPQYKSPSTYNDIALLKTDRVMELDQFTVPACLHVGDVVNDTKVIAAGWGFTHAAGQEPSDILKRVVLSKFSTQECSNKYKTHRLMKRGYDGQTMTCYGDRDPPQWYEGGSRAEYKDTCQGDSGTPIQIKDEKINCMYTIVGVTSLGKGCGNGDKPGIYTRVAHYLPWIENIVWPH